MKKEIYKEKIELKEVHDDDVNFTAINCPSCQTKVPADNLELNKGVAKCSGCHVVFPINRTIQTLVNNANGPDQKVLRPDGIEIFEYRNELEIVVDQPLRIFDILLMAFLPFITFVLTMISLEAGISSLWPIGMGTITTLYFLDIMNRKRKKVYLTANSEALTIQWRPKRMSKDKSFARENIEQLYRKEDGLYVIINNFGERKHIKLFSTLLNSAKANYIERTIENYLGIEDQKSE